ncbi:hypothetical protein STSP2_01568 [Anaerohalosphaera lusitana]|uniref:Zinc-ribbon domain-containing protein n=1 Tax=Anaerohalosphaera lusitana TaxID=1936003 RepID=A0A1U9NL03_9BACT|nr:hypothetical protein [Anaerohalosphaera lusitana]AQT68408.1 hypothetical protein STSP2_01568 [Anaerohalosphaera lusitana]
MGLDDMLGDFSDDMTDGTMMGPGFGGANSRSSSQPQNLGQAHSRITHLETALAKTLTICEALWEIMRDENGYTDAMIQAKVRQIDNRDGKQDGRNKSAPIKCSNCGRTIAPRHQACMYCGNPNEKSLFSM